MRTPANDGLPGEGTHFTVERFETREEWLAARRTAITGSDAAGLWRDEIGGGISPLDVYARKVAGETEADALNLEMGRALEPLVRSTWERETGRAITYPGPFVLLRSLAHPHLTVSLDGAIVEEPAGFEAKAWTGGAALWREGVPLSVEAQVRHGMIVTGWPVFVVAGIIVGKWCVRHVEADPSFASAHIARASDLWARIQDGAEPIATAGDGDALSLLHPRETTGAVELGAAATTWAAALEQAKAEAKALDGVIELASARLRQAIGDAEGGILPDGTIYTLRTVKRAEYTVQPGTYRQLRRKGERT